MLRLLLALLICWYEQDNLWAVGLSTAVVVLLETLGDSSISRYRYTALSLVLQSVLGPLLALALRHVHHRSILSWDRLAPQLGRTASQALRALLLVGLGLSAYQRLIVDDREHAFPQGILLSALLLFVTALLCEVMTHHGRVELSRSDREQRRFSQAREGQTVVMVNVCLVVMAVDLLAWELRPQWPFAVLLGATLALRGLSEAVDWAVRLPDRMTKPDTHQGWGDH